MKNVTLGKKYKDTVSCYEGVAMCETRWLNGCVRVGMQSKVNKDGKLPDLMEFDVQQLEIVKEAKESLEPKKKCKGGDPSFTPKQN